MTAVQNPTEFSEMENPVVRHVGAGHDSNGHVLPGQDEDMVFSEKMALLHPSVSTQSNDSLLEQTCPQSESSQVHLLRRSNSLGSISPAVKQKEIHTDPRTQTVYQNQSRQTSSDQSIFTDDYFVSSTESLQHSQELGARPKSQTKSISTSCLQYNDYEESTRLLGSSPARDFECSRCEEHAGARCEEHADLLSDDQPSSDSMFSDQTHQQRYTTHSNDEEMDSEIISKHYNLKRGKQYKHKIRRSQEREQPEVEEEDKYHQEQERYHQYLKQQREQRRRRRASSKSSKASRKNTADFDVETSSLLYPDAYGYSISYTSIADLQDVYPSDDEWEAGSCHLYKGMILAVLSGILFTANNFVLVKFKVAPIDATLIRGFVHVLVLGFILRRKVWCDRLGLVILQGIIGALGLTCALYCVTLMPVPDALTIIFTSPLPTFILAVIIMGESPSVLKVVSMVALIFGVVLVCKPSFLFPSHQVNDSYNEEEYIGITLAILSSIFAGITNVVASYSKEINNRVIVFWVAMSALVIASGLEFIIPGCKIMTLKGAEYTFTQWGVLFGLAVSGLIAYQSMVKSLQMISPTLVSALRSLEIVLAFAIQSAIDLAPPEPISSTGAFLVCFGICLSGIASWLSRPRRGYESLD